MNVYMGKNPILYIKADGKGHPGLLIRYHDLKSGLDLGLVAVLFFALFSTVFYLYLMFGGDSINWWPVIHPSSTAYQPTYVGPRRSLHPHVLDIILSG